MYNRIRTRDLPRCSLLTVTLTLCTACAVPLTRDGLSDCVTAVIWKYEMRGDADGPRLVPRLHISCSLLLSISVVYIPNRLERISVTRITVKP